VVPDEQAKALEEHHASSGKTVLFDGEDGFVEAGSIKVALKIKLSLYEKVLDIGWEVRLGKRLSRFRRFTIRRVFFFELYLFWSAGHGPKPVVITRLHLRGSDGAYVN
jgi:hypothetical protein